MHSNKSDGIYAPTALVDMAKQRGLDCISLTDHDTVGGISEASSRAKEVGLGFIVGVELSSYSVCDVHILGYNINVRDSGFVDELSAVAEMRNKRNDLMFGLLKEHGINIDPNSLVVDGGTIGRGTVAREIVKQGYCSSVTEVFEKYLGVDKCCYVQSKRLTPVEAIQLVLRYGGIPVLAHPKQLRLGDMSFERFLKPLVLAGLGGIEADYFTHTTAERRYYGKMAKKYRLIVTGGSDFHDYTHGVELGTKSFSPSGYTRTILGI